jgi:hypothetical protein
MTDPGTRKTFTDADTDTDEPVQPTSGADELRRSNDGGDTDEVDGEPASAQEPPD